MIISVFDSGMGSDSLDEMRKVERVEQRVKNMIRRLDADSIYMKSSSNLIFAISNRKDQDLGRIGETIRTAVGEQPDMKVAIGIDDKCRPYTMMHISYSKAYKALQSCLRTSGEGVRFYNDINMEIFTDEISDMSKKEYVQKLFSGYNREELAEAVGLLETLYELDGSITAASEKLHMHKNTLQYKLKRICERTGYDPRSIRWSSLFYIAIDFYREIRNLIGEE